MIIKASKINLYILVICSFLFFSLISVVVFLHTHVLFGASDMQFHMKRIMEWYESMMHGMLLPFFSYNYFHGSAVMSMYPYLSMFPFIILFKITSSIILSYYIFFTIIIFIALLISFFSSLKYSKSYLVSYIFAITYSMSSLFTFKMFTDGDLGVATSLVFLPLVIFGYLDVISGSKNYLKMTFGILLMSFCQVAALIIIMTFLFLWSLVNIKHINKGTILELLKSLVLSILLTSLSWEPILAISFNNKINTVMTKHLTGFSLKFLIENISVFALIAIILGIFCLKRINYLDRQMYFLSILVIIVSSKLIPWHFITSLPVLNIANQFQFTFRFLIIPQILLSYIFALVIYKFLQSSNKSKILFPSIIFILILSQIAAQSAIVYRKSSLINMRFNNFKDVKKYETNTTPHHGDLFNDNRSMMYFINGYSTNRDYYPKISRNEIRNIHNYKGIYGHNHSVVINHVGFDKFKFYSYKNIHDLILPFVIYRGENVKIYLNDYRKQYVNDKNVIKLKNIPKGINSLRIQYVINPVIDIFKYVLFLLGVIWVVLCLKKLIRFNSYSC